MSRWVEDGSYLRLKNINLSYSLPKSITDKMRINTVRAFVSAANLITITNYSGYDPEVSSYNANDAQIGVDLIKIIFGCKFFCLFIHHVINARH